MRPLIFVSIREQLRLGVTIASTILCFGSVELFFRVLEFTLKRLHIVLRIFILEGIINIFCLVFVSLNRFNFLLDCLFDILLLLFLSSLFFGGLYCCCFLGVPSVVVIKGIHHFQFELKGFDVFPRIFVLIISVSVLRFVRSWRRRGEMGGHRKEGKTETTIIVKGVIPILIKVDIVFVDLLFVFVEENDGNFFPLVRSLLVAKNRFQEQDFLLL
mmetsp:Transcript_4275/g.10173  ORF Transcript_4275/g.10173 Transcript_4275/m.10173 type:complete len:215 (+) Transcript_4275:290-934(+)